MTDYEKLGSFYLGKLFDHKAGKTSDDLLLYEAKDLTTHAVCVGMTGSGKTGLCVGLLEEAAIDGIPAIVIDPKGDLANLMLTFPDLAPGDFEPWLEEAEAARKGMSLPEMAQKTADTWKKGLESWHQSPDRIRRLKETTDLSIYTPGSTAGRPITVLRSFDAPPQEIMDDPSLSRDYIVSAVSGLLALVGISGDPLRSREHILLSSILDHYWRLGQNLDIPALIHGIQKPPFNKVGVFDLETFYPASDRLVLAMALNNLIASPGFSVWTQGEPLNIQRLLYTPEGKPRIAILSIAHLADSERMFFVTILLNAMVAWMRTQSGTSSLRALLYMDEIFGYFPPTANPPSKQPMLTLLKQARAFGLGVVLSTQNPVDLDYKGLANTGTWLIGRLQTDRDKARVLDGLESAALGSGMGFARSEMDKLLSGLGNRVFLLHNVHQSHPVLFQTRWVLSYLRGPLTLNQIKKLVGPAPEVEEQPPIIAPVIAPPVSANTVSSASAPLEAAATEAPKQSRPNIPTGIDEYYIRPKTVGAETVAYESGVIAIARLHFVNAKAKVDTWKTIQLTHPGTDRAELFEWSHANVAMNELVPLDRQPLANASFGDVADPLTTPKNFKTWERMLKSHIYQEITMDLVYCPDLKMSSKPGESEGDFKARLQVVLREKRDGAIDKLRKRYATEILRLQDRIRRAEVKLEKEQEQYSQQKLSTVISFGSTVLGALLGRRSVSAGTVSKTATTMRGASRASKEKQDIGRAQEAIVELQERLDVLQQELDTELERIKDEMNMDELEIIENPIRPRKSDISVTNIGIGWNPTT